MFVLKKNDSYLLSVNPKHFIFGPLSFETRKRKNYESMAKVLKKASAWGHNINNVTITEVDIPESEHISVSRPIKEKKHKNSIEKEYSIKVDKDSKVISISIPQCPTFKMAFRSWDSNPLYFKWITMSNYDSIQYRNHTISDRVGGCVEFSNELSIPGDYWGDNIPTKLRNIIKTSIEKYVKEIEEESWCSGTNKIKIFPVSAFNNLKKDLENNLFTCEIKRINIRKTDFKIEPDENSQVVEIDE